ncbi:MAG: DUF4339 domain-containing protein [Verrucomicrobia bacterium]|nr:DUF4339 domain-containing protein [Verrucomicrobiota bacterium]
MQWPDIPTTFAISCLIGTLSAYMAHRRGKNPYIWFSIGALFGLLGVMAIFFTSKKPEPKPVPVKPPEPTLAGPSDKFWYYLDPDHQQMGPLSLDALKRTWKEGKINDSTYVWHEDLSDWTPLQTFIRI